MLLLWGEALGGTKSMMSAIEPIVDVVPGVAGGALEPVFVEEKTETIISHKISVGIPDTRRPASRARNSDSLELCVMAPCFLTDQDNGTKVLGPTNARKVHWCFCCVGTQQRMRRQQRASKRSRRFCHQHNRPARDAWYTTCS